MSDASEKTYLVELIRDFGTGKATDPEEVLRQIQSNYRRIEFDTDNFISYLLKNKESFGLAFKTWTKIFHKFLFYNILTNAGEFRRSTDNGGGTVLFGVYVHRNPFGTQFKGTHPDSIESEMEHIFILFSDNDTEPIYTAIKFYQKFVRIHPFYDANGRVARFLNTIYLSYHGFYVEWKKLEGSKKNKFLSKLNDCHLRENQNSYEEYLGYLYNFWKEFVVKKDTLTS